MKKLLSKNSKEKLSSIYKINGVDTPKDPPSPIPPIIPV